MSAHMDAAGVQEQGCLFVKTITASDKSRREKVRKAGADTCVRNTLTLHATNGRVVGLAKECLAWIEMDMGPICCKRGLEMVEHVEGFAWSPSSTFGLDANARADAI